MPRKNIKTLLIVEILLTVFPFILTPLLYWMLYGMGLVTTTLILGSLIAFLCIPYTVRLWFDMHIRDSMNYMMKFERKFPVLDTHEGSIAPVPSSPCMIPKHSKLLLKGIYNEARKTLNSMNMFFVLGFVALIIGYAVMSIYFMSILMTLWVNDVVLGRVLTATLTFGYIAFKHILNGELNDMLETFNDGVYNTMEASLLDPFSATLDADEPISFTGKNIL